MSRCRPTARGGGGGGGSDGDNFVRGPFWHTSNFGAGPSDTGNSNTPNPQSLADNQLCEILVDLNFNNIDSSEINKKKKEQQCCPQQRIIRRKPIVKMFTSIVNPAEAIQKPIHHQMHTPAQKSKKEPKQLSKETRPATRSFGGRNRRGTEEELQKVVGTNLMPWKKGNSVGQGYVSKSHIQRKSIVKKFHPTQIQRRPPKYPSLGTALRSLRDFPPPPPPPPHSSCKGQGAGSTPNWAKNFRADF